MAPGRTIVLLTMKTTKVQILLALASACALAATETKALGINRAVELFDENVRNYNLIALGDAYHAHTTEGAIAVAGLLQLTGTGTQQLASTYGTGSTDPAVYVGGEVQLRPGGILQSNQGSISLPRQFDATWDPTQRRLYTDSSRSSWVQMASPDNPVLNSGPANWDLDALRASFSEVSDTLGSATATGSFRLEGQTLSLSGAQWGLGVFDLDVSRFDWMGVSLLDLSVPSDAVYVINVRNADGATFLGNLNTRASGTSAQRLLWNFVGKGEATLANNGELYGSILAEDWHLRFLDKQVTGQLVAGSFESQAPTVLRYASFTPAALPADAVPVSLSSLLGLGSTLGVFGLFGYRRRR